MFLVPTLPVPPFLRHARILYSLQELDLSDKDLDVVPPVVWTLVDANIEQVAHEVHHPEQKPTERVGLALKQIPQRRIWAHDPSPRS